jgi:RNA polymerase sigma factor (sigma-70 family)
MERALRGVADTRRARRQAQERRKRSSAVTTRIRNGSNAEYEALLLENLSFIERTVSSIARRHAVKPWDRDDFEGLVKLRLVADDYAVLRKFQGRSKLTTFLTSVIQNLFRDFRIQRWGKWRSSASAKRLGDLGVQLESLLYRDRFSFQEACEILRERFDVQASDAQLATMAGEIQPRTTRRFESDATLASLEAPERGDQALLDGEREDTLERARQALCRALAELSLDDRLILKMRFAECITIRAIAETLDVEPRQMYGRLQQLLGDVRRRVEEQGVSCEDVLGLLAWPKCELEEVL